MMCNDIHVGQKFNSYYKSNVFIKMREKKRAKKEPKKKPITISNRKQERVQTYILFKDTSHAVPVLRVGPGFLPSA